MATLNWVDARTRSPFLRSISHIPYITGDDDDYIDGINLYLQERCSGRIRLNRGVVNSVGTYHRSHNTIRSIGYNLANFVSWLYHPACHPDQGVIHWSDVASWHIDDLYREHMLLGFWTQEYWATSHKYSLNFPNTIRPKLREVHTCFEWLGKQGIVEWPKPEPSLQARTAAYNKSVHALTHSLPASMRAAPPEELKYKRRPDPGNWAPLTPEQLQAILKCIDKPVGALTVLLFLWTGMRRAELIENTLVPGTLHLRSERQRSLHWPNFPQHAYQLLYNVRDDRMIGVLPDEKAAFQDGDTMLPMRILGKGNKIRTVYIPSALMREIWRYYVIKRPRPATEHSSAMFINHRGRRLEEWTVNYALSQAKKRVLKISGENIQVTPHVLRHTFACLSLEAVISGRAREHGHEPSRLTHNQIESYGAEALVIIQELLGHAMAKDTARYLRQLSLGRAGLSYLEFFSAALKETLGDGASF